MRVASEEDRTGLEVPLDLFSRRAVRDRIGVAARRLEDSAVNGTVEIAGMGGEIHSVNWIVSQTRRKAGHVRDLDG